jgi:hypothetical protein
MHTSHTAHKTPKSVVTVFLPYKNSHTAHTAHTHRNSPAPLGALRTVTVLRKIAVTTFGTQPSRGSDDNQAARSIGTHSC